MGKSALQRSSQQKVGWGGGRDLLYRGNHISLGANHRPTVGEGLKFYVIFRKNLFLERVKGRRGGCSHSMFMWSPSPSSHPLSTPRCSLIILTPFGFAISFLVRRKWNLNLADISTTDRVMLSFISSTPSIKFLRLAHERCKQTHTNADVHFLLPSFAMNMACVFHP